MSNKIFIMTLLLLSCNEVDIVKPKEEKNESYYYSGSPVFLRNDSVFVKQCGGALYYVGKLNGRTIELYSSVDV